MKIINLTQTQYKNYAAKHPFKNFGQTTEFASLESNARKKKLFLALIDDSSVVHAATLILIIDKNAKIKEAYAPNGFLIDYSNYSLVAVFTEELKKYLLKEKVTYLVTNPMFKYKVYNKEHQITLDNEAYLTNLYNLGYISLGYINDFERYDVIVEGNTPIKDIYQKFNRNTKRNINEALKLGITLEKGRTTDLDKAYKLFHKKTKNSLYYYQNLLNIYNNEDNLMEIFFTKINPHKYLVNCKKMYETEKIKNEQLHEKFNLNYKKINERLLNKKINSDKTLEKYSENLNRAIKLSQNYQEDIIIGTSIIIRNKHEIYFLIDGYNENYRFIHSTHVLKWALIKKYYTLGYRIFNLGEIHKDYFNKQSKYHNQYLFKIGFGGKVVEYSPNLLLVVNPRLYNAYNKIEQFKLKWK